MGASQMQPLFVEEIPQRLETGILYISIEFATAQHLCACGCGSEVVTPLHPTAWSVTYDGETVSISPSIGSGSLRCRSHYFIYKNKVRWTEWSEEEMQLARQRDRAAVDAFFKLPDAEPAVASDPESNPSSSFLGRVARMFRDRGKPPSGA